MRVSVSPVTGSWGQVWTPMKAPISAARAAVSSLSKCRTSREGRNCDVPGFREARGSPRDPYVHLPARLPGSRRPGSSRGPPGRAAAEAAASQDWYLQTDAMWGAPPIRATLDCSTAPSGSSATGHQKRSKSGQRSRVLRLLRVVSAVQVVPLFQLCVWKCRVLMSRPAVVSGPRWRATRQHTDTIQLSSVLGVMRVHGGQIPS